LTGRIPPEKAKVTTKPDRGSRRKMTAGKRKRDAKANRMK